ncbi:GroES-like protein, partial [Tothia fuscella]
MKEAIILKGPEVNIIDSPIPTPSPDQVVTKVVFSGSNPKDWKVAEWMDIKVNQGDDISGIVHAVGTNVTEFKPGDRVAAFHEMLKPGGSYAEYALSWEHTTFHLPSSTTFEEGASLPLASMTAALGMYQRLGLPVPWTPAEKKGQSGPLLIWGASAAVGSYALQFAVKSGIHPVICVAGRAGDHVKKFLDESKGDVVLDYRKGDDVVIQQIKDALKGGKLHYAFDAVSENGSYQAIVKVLESDGHITLVLPGKKYPEIPESVHKTITSVGASHNNPEDKDFAYVFFRYISKGLKDGWFKGHPTEKIPGGLGGVQQGLTNLKEGKASAVKYIFRIDE